MERKGFRKSRKPTNKEVEAVNGELNMELRAVNLTLTEFVKSYNKFTKNTELLFEIMECKTSALMNLVADIKPELKDKFNDYFKAESFKLMEKKEADMDRKLHRVETVEPAKILDWVTINYKMKIEGMDEFNGNTVENLIVRIGEGKILDELENSFVGKKAGDEYSVAVKFPGNYFSEKMRNKDAIFDVKIVKVKTIVKEKKDGK